MGCSSSKEWQIVPELGDATLPRSFSVSLPRSFSLTSWKQTRRPKEEILHSSAYDTPKLEMKKNSDSQHEKLASKTEETNYDASNKSIPMFENSNVANVRLSKAIDPVSFADEVPEVINVSDLMQGLEEDAASSIRPHTRKRPKRKAHRRSFSSSHMHTGGKQRGPGHNPVEILSYLSALHCPEFGLEKKPLYTFAEQLCSRCARCQNELARTAFIWNNNLASVLPDRFKRVDCGVDFAYRGYDIYPDRKFAKSYGANPFTDSIAADITPEIFIRRSRAQLQSQDLLPQKIELNLDSASALHPNMPTLGTDAVSRSPNTYPTAVADGYRSPTFDPAILSIIEKALVDDYDSLHIGYHARSNTEGRTSRNQDIHPEIPDCYKLSETEIVSGEEKLRRDKTDESSPRCLEMIDKEICTESLIEPKSFATLRKQKASIEDFEVRCPSQGDDRLVLYVTSLRTIRKTFEDCNFIRSTLQAFNIKIDERDVSIHSAFKRELVDLLDNPFPVPRLFIKGRYIGGVEEFMQLNEGNILAELLKGLPTETPGKICEGCGGFRFIPCTECSGSCKIVGEDDSKIRCPDCNENGLVCCQMCF